MQLLHARAEFVQVLRSLSDSRSGDFLLDAPARGQARLDILAKADSDLALVSMHVASPCSGMLLLLERTRHETKALLDLLSAFEAIVEFDFLRASIALFNSNKWIAQVLPALPLFGIANQQN